MAPGKPAICPRRCRPQLPDAVLPPALARRALPFPAVADGTRNFSLSRAARSRKRICEPARRNRCPDCLSAQSSLAKANDAGRRTQDAGRTKPEGRKNHVTVVFHKVIRHSFELPHWDFVILAVAIWRRSAT